MHVHPVVHALVAALLVACTDAPEGPDIFATGVPAQDRSGDEVWVLHVHGSETWERRAGSGPEIACSLAWLYDLDQEARRIMYSDELDLDVAAAEVLVASAVFGRGGCPVAYDLTDAATGQTTPLDLGVLGSHDAVVLANGTLVLDGRSFLLGEGARLDAATTRTADGNTYRVSALVDLEVLGAWPKEHVEVA